MTDTLITDYEVIRETPKARLIQQGTEQAWVPKKHSKITAEGFEAAHWLEQLYPFKVKVRGRAPERKPRRKYGPHTKPVSGPDYEDLHDECLMEYNPFEFF